MGKLGDAVALVCIWNMLRPDTSLAGGWYSLITVSISSVEMLVNCTLTSKDTRHQSKWEEQVFDLLDKIPIFLNLVLVASPLQI